MAAFHSQSPSVDCNGRLSEAAEQCCRKQAEQFLARLSLSTQHRYLEFALSCMREAFLGHYRMQQTRTEHDRAQQDLYEAHQHLLQMAPDFQALVHSPNQCACPSRDEREWQNGNCIKDVVKEFQGLDGQYAENLYEEIGAPYTEVESHQARIQLRIHVLQCFLYQNIANKLERCCRQMKADHTRLCHQFHAIQRGDYQAAFGEWASAGSQPHLQPAPEQQQQQQPDYEPCSNFSSNSTATYELPIDNGNSQPGGNRIEYEQTLLQPDFAQQTDLHGVFMGAPGPQAQDHAGNLPQMALDSTTFTGYDQDYELLSSAFDFDSSGVLPELIPDEEYQRCTSPSNFIDFSNGGMEAESTPQEFDILACLDPEAFSDSSIFGMNMDSGSLFCPPPTMPELERSTQRVPQGSEQEPLSSFGETNDMDDLFEDGSTDLEVPGQEGMTESDENGWAGISEAELQEMMGIS